MRTSMIVLTAALAFGCGKKKDDPPKEPAKGSAPKEPAKGSAKEPAGPVAKGSAEGKGSAAPKAGGAHPLLTTLGFPNTKLGADVGQYAFAPNDSRLKSAVEGQKHELNVLGYGVVQIKSVGETESKVYSSSEWSVPNAFILPIPKGQTVAKGDIVVASQYGNSLDHAYVIADGDKPKANFNHSMPYDKPHEKELTPDQFIKVDGSELQPGSIIAHPSLIGGAGKWDKGVIVRVEGDQVLVHGHMGHMKVWKKTDLRQVPAKVDAKVGDTVYAIWDTVHFSEGKVTKVDTKLGILVLSYPKPFDKDPKPQPFGSIAPAVFK